MQVFHFQFSITGTHLAELGNFLAFVEQAMLAGRNTVARASEISALRCTGGSGAL